MERVSGTDLASRVRGGLLGLLVGDALGVPYEFSHPSHLPPPHLIDFEPPAGFPRAHAGTPPGTWSDDGAQALCLLASLLDRGRLDLEDFSARLVAWHDRGYLAVDGRTFDVGLQTRRAIDRLRAGALPHTAGPSGERDNGNGSLMRVLPLALWHRGSDADLFRDAREQSRVTHGHPRSMVACGLYCLWARRLVEGVADAFASALSLAEGLVAPSERAELALLASPADPVRGSGYVVDSLRAARHLLESPQGTYSAVVRSAVALGDDTDTTAAIAGGLAGIRSGAEAIPEAWRVGLRGRELCDPLLDALVART
jgi:ADP-ribosylglycohydrolase